MPTDDPLDNKPWVKLVEECVALFDELERIRPSLDEAGQDFAEHLSCRLQEMLERAGVTIISEDSTFDCHRHQSASSLAATADGAMIHKTFSPGFAVGRRVFRRARVELAGVTTTTEKEPLL